MRRSVLFLLIWLLPALCHAACFETYWIAPTEKCEESSEKFIKSLQKFGFTQNRGGVKDGDQIVWLYSPGKYPYLDGESDAITAINGGVPQNVDMKKHRAAFKADMDKIVGEHFSGIGIIDYSGADYRNWYPLRHQNLNGRSPYQDKSYGTEEQFNNGAETFMTKTLEYAKGLRPKARWGYYGYPYCVEPAGEMHATCFNDTQEDNDKLSWLWKKIDILLPSTINVSKSADVRTHVRARVTEMKRIVSKHSSNIIPAIYFRSLHVRDGSSFLEKDDISAALNEMIEHDCRIAVFNESRDDMHTREKCQDFLDNLNTILGPAVKETIDSVPRKECPDPSEINIDPPRRTKNLPTRGGDDSTKEDESDSSLEYNEEPENPKKPIHHNYQLAKQPLPIIFFAICSYFIIILT